MTSHTPCQPPYQTEMEMGEMIMYENNLADCNEAEYLLSVKLQDERGLLTSADYMDDSEVLVSDSAALYSCSGSDDHHTSHLDTATSECVSHSPIQAECQRDCLSTVRFDCSSESEVMEQDLNPKHFETHKLVKGFLPSNTSSNHQTCNGTTSPGLCHPQKNITLESGFTLPYTPACGLVPPVSHPDGPQRKRACIHRPE